MRTKIIGLAGQARAGKDTAGRFIEAWAQTQEPLRGRTQVHAFAHELKLSAAAALGFHDTDGEAVAFCDELKANGSTIAIRLGNYPPEKEYYITGRQFLQFYGTEAHREVFGDNFWIDALFDGIIDAELVVITDCRFKNEAYAVKDRGGEVWEIIRDGAGVAGSHISEAGLPDDLIDVKILNNGDRADLKSLVELTCEARL